MKSNKKTKWNYYLPLILVAIYLLMSYVMYRYGCYVWSFREDNITGLFVIMCLTAFIVGYVSVIKKIKEKEVPVISFLPETVLKVCLIVSILIYIPMSITYTNSWYPPILDALLNPQKVYYELAEVVQNRSGIRIWGLLDVFPYMLLPLTLWIWEKLSKRMKSVGLIVSIGYLAIYVSSARNISVVIQMLSVVAVLLCAIFSDNEECRKERIRRLTVISLIYIVIAISFFGLTMSKRIGYSSEVAEKLNENNEDTTLVNGNTDSNFDSVNTDNNSTNSNLSSIDEEEVYYFPTAAKTYDAEKMGQSLGVGTYEYNGLEITKQQWQEFDKVYQIFPNYTDIWSKAYVNTEDILVRYLPTFLSNLYVMATGYITNGYNCLTVALHTEHEWTYMIGHSNFLCSYVDRFLGTSITSSTYYSRITNDEIYPLVSKSHWPSAFVQWADDLTFYGVVVFFGILGYFIATVWISIICKSNYWGVLLLGELMLGVLFIPANNILENSGGFFVTFWVVFILWWLTHMKIIERFLNNRKRLIIRRLVKN